MSVQKTITQNFTVSAKVSYLESESKPELNYYVFVYKVTISAGENSSAQLLSRHWFITDLYGHTEEIRGPGVVGIQPKIYSGQSFEYESACPLPTPSGSMRGTYRMISEDSSLFDLEIPEFYLVAPSALH